MSRDSFNSSSSIGRFSKNGVVVGTMPPFVNAPYELWGKRRTLVCATGDVDNEAKLAREVRGVDMCEANEDFVLVNALDSALESILACCNLRSRA